ncbi:MAG: hypothetical protein ACLRP7_04735, partial [Christensenellales bacterium]
ANTHRQLEKLPTEQENKPYGQRYKKQKTEILSREDVEKGYENIIKFYKNLLNNIKHQIIMIR